MDGQVTGSYSNSSSNKADGVRQHPVSDDGLDSRMTEVPPENERRGVVGNLLVVVCLVCLVNAGIAVGLTGRVEGSKPERLERRYGALRPHLEGVATAVYTTDDGWRFLNARYALAPVVLDPRFVEPAAGGRAIASVDVAGIVELAADQSPLVILADFKNRKTCGGFLRELSEATGASGLDIRILKRMPRGVVLAVVED